MRVVVIGSGAAGLAAMRRLFEAGILAVCLEAADRIGGRVNTVPFADGLVDLGAQVLEGVEGNSVTQMLKPLGILEDIAQENRSFVKSNGDIIPTEVATNFAKEMGSLVAEANVTIVKSALEVVRKTQASDAFPQLDPSLKTGLLEWYARFHEYAGQSDLKRSKSLAGLKDRLLCKGPLQGFKGKGIGQVLDVLMNKIPDPSQALPLDVQLKKEVDTITWKTADGLVKVTCKDGSTFEADSVISTISVGVLQERYTTLFDPPLPADKLNAIQAFDMLVLDKIFMEFTAPWWPEVNGSFSLVWRPEDAVQFKDEEKWIAGVYGMDTVEGQPNVLVAWINDDGARLMEKTSEEDVKRSMGKLLEHAFGKFSLTPIKAVLRTKWATNRWERGAYAYRSVYSEEHSSNLAASLSAPLVNDGGFPVVCFAGDATSTHHSASVHGAVESGFREAERLIRLKK